MESPVICTVFSGTWKGRVLPFLRPILPFCKVAVLSCPLWDHSPPQWLNCRTPPIWILEKLILKMAVLCLNLILYVFGVARFKVVEDILWENLKIFFANNDQFFIITLLGSSELFILVAVVRGVDSTLKRCDVFEFHQQHTFLLLLFFSLFHFLKVYFQILKAFSFKTLFSWYW